MIGLVLALSSLSIQILPCHYIVSDSVPLPHNGLRGRYSGAVSAVYERNRRRGKEIARIINAFRKLDAQSKIPDRMYVHDFGWVIWKGNLTMAGKKWVKTLAKPKSP